MYLKQLDILGFKSFANKTSIRFSSGITAIVGPNGCGKTNILDALRWVLGEQRVTLLRGSKMEEVVFNGTRDVKPLGLAEVTLTLVNNRGVLPTEYNEIQITRRLFRSGESEYLINKVPCRLKDITEMFYDTGVGAHSYSVIQQDMIDAVISDKAEERRFLFEEAAGITKYKQRRKAALRKLESTEHDLLRLQDIHAEVKTRVNSLKRQYKKAERYQLVRDDIRNWEIYLSSFQIKEMESERRRLSAQVEGMSDNILEKQAAIDTVSADLENDRKRQVDQEHQSSIIGGQVYDITDKAHSVEKEISILKEKESNARQLIDRNETDITALKIRSTILSEQTQQAAGELAQLKDDSEAVAVNLSDAEKAQAVTDQRLLEARADKEKRNREFIVLEGKLSSGKTEEGGLREQGSEFDNTLVELNRQIEENASLQKLSNTQHKSKSQSLDTLRSDKEELERAQKQKTEELEALLLQNDELTDELTSLTASIEACQARKSLLEEMIVHYEGYQSGMSSVMNTRDRWPGCLGAVANLFDPREGMEQVLESALGELAGYLVCSDRQTAEEIIAYLKKEKKGKIGILVPDSGTLNPVIRRPEMSMPGFKGWLDSHVTCRQELRPLMEAVLSRIAVFDSATPPEKILEMLPYGFKAVSTEGVVFGKNIITGGFDDGLPLFGRREKVAEQDKMLDELQVRLEQTSDEKNRKAARTAELRADISRASEKFQSLNESISTLQQEVDAVRFELQASGREAERLSKERNSAAGKLLQIRHRQGTLELDYDQLSNNREELLENMAGADKRLADLEKDASAQANQVSMHQIKLVEARSRIEQCEHKIVHQHELQQEIQNTTEAKTLEIERARTQISGGAKQIFGYEAELKTVFTDRTVLTKQQTDLKTGQSDILGRIDQKEQQLKSLRAEKDGLNDRLHQSEIHLNTVQAEVRSIHDKITEDYELDINQAEVVCPDDQITRDQARKHLAEQKEKLKKFGAVNLLALEEYRTADERDKFLDEQLGDLMAAKTDLETTISRINQTARKLFSDTFAQVRLNFQKMFVELFSGGEADLQLVDSSNPLESDIEITARPSGKKILSITMMSGGERALTAISLLFSLYLVKPSPYCILDEIDAPLDDANCHRFLKLIRSFSEQTQFITITHNKITMEAAHNLYGVTMEQPGITKLVGVKFSDVEHDDETGEIIITASPSSEPEKAEVEVPPAVMERITPVAIPEQQESDA